MYTRSRINRPRIFSVGPCQISRHSRYAVNWMARAYARQGDGWMDGMDGWMDGWLVGWLVGWLMVAMPTSPSTLVSSLSIHSPFYSPVCPSISSVHVVRYPVTSSLPPRALLFSFMVSRLCRVRETDNLVKVESTLLLEPLENVRRLRRHRAETVTRPPPRFVPSLDALNFLRLAIRPPGPSKPFTFPTFATKRLVRHVTLPQSLQHGANRRVARPWPVVVSSKV